MIKNKMLAIGMGCLISIASVVPAFAVENTARDPAAKAVKIEAKQQNQADKLAKLQEKAVKLGVSIDGLSKEDARAKLELAFSERLTERSTKLGVDISNLSKEDAKEKVKQAATVKKEERSVKLKAVATKLGVDISGLTNKEATSKINEAKANKRALKAENQAAKTTNN